MAKDKDENGDGGKTENANVLIAQVLQQLVANQPARIITQDSPEYAARLTAEGFYDYFSAPVYQNAKKAEPRGLSAEVRERAVKLTPGEYMVGKTKVSVERTHDGGIHLKYPSKSVEDRMAYASSWSDFSDLVNKLWAQMNLASV
jgi:hypothetical protein